MVVAASAAPTGPMTAPIVSPSASPKRPPGPCRRDLGVGERQIEQRGDRAQKERDAQRLAEPVDERPAAEATNRRDEKDGDEEVAGEPHQAVGPRRERVATGTHQRIAADVHRQQRKAREQPARQQQIPPISRRRAWRDLAGGSACVLAAMLSSVGGR